MNRIFPILGVVAALVGLGDSVYLTVHHLTATPVPCSIVSGCETVLTSEYAEVAGIPLAAFGAAAYFVAFALALLAVYENRTAWTLFGILAAVMAAASLLLIYVQAFVLHAFCQFCLLSAATSFSLLIIFAISKFTRGKIQSE